MTTTYKNNNNFTPIIGILCMDIAEPLRKFYGNEYCSYIAASYVKYLESAGARVIPICILLPGGAVFFDNKYCTEELRNDCVLSSKHIYEIAKQLNEKGKHFPLWGTCIGFQLMLTHSADMDDIRQDCRHMNCSLPIKFEDDKGSSINCIIHEYSLISVLVLENSKLFGHIDKTIKDKMSTLPFGCHYHRYCITKEDLNFYKISKQWKVLACNEDENCLEFVTILEHNEFPFFGSQIHPERVIYENFGKDDDAFHHCLECFELTTYFAKFFVNQCSLNQNRFDNTEEELRYSICNFPITYTAANKLHWRQCYLFKNNIDYPKDNVDEVLNEII